ncbi:hypothetical protein L596_000619 [Steinernema carpocapsae]|uniref:Uncharacterized protein n=1 Tax=Steinernema carpocapsae TaxID=34508 RepID=A0A4U8UMV4_STECR|nr:hypothetical protein L596_000619 [Steinernema carpocapsae]
MTSSTNRRRAPPRHEAARRRRPSLVAQFKLDERTKDLQAAATVTAAYHGLGQRRRRSSSSTLFFCVTTSFVLFLRVLLCKYSCYKVKSPLKAYLCFRLRLYPQ